MRLTQVVQNVAHEFDGNSLAVEGQVLRTERIVSRSCRNLLQAVRFSSDEGRVGRGSDCRSVRLDFGRIRSGHCAPKRLDFNKEAESVCCASRCRVGCTCCA